MIRLRAKIHLFTERQNGASKDGFSGMRPSFGFAGELITSEIVSPEGSANIYPRGSWSEVEIKLPYGEIFGDSIYKGMEFRINVGGWQVGHGKVEEIIEVFHDPKNADLLGDKP